ncbi:DUF4907 domain-containing protein [Thermoflavifilum thermophilum]|uniref:DUF4907 domain-containing protein n=1 Tax=Thermoflavifilum thermophilum TaxID=1393122 RepID=A0A1I7NDQ3_9BACT|nr:DUF4907 domain-containing protein [Thermoflavifilum thermophilum]SFV32815.1 protein of unknown function [Thermoflavifilum thermophilum]
MGEKESFFRSTQKYRIFTFSGALALVVLIIIFMHTFLRHSYYPALSNGQDSLSVQVIVMHVDSGWGYQIWINNRPFIYQNQIPAIPGHHVFHSRADAMRVGTRVAGKILQHEPPTITVAELQQLGIAEAHP